MKSPSSSQRCLPYTWVHMHLFNRVLSSSFFLSRHFTTGKNLDFPWPRNCDSTHGDRTNYNVPAYTGTDISGEKKPLVNQGGSKSTAGLDSIPVCARTGFRVHTCFRCVICLKYDQRHVRLGTDLLFRPSSHNSRSCSSRA